MHRGTHLGMILAALVSLFVTCSQTAYASVDPSAFAQAARAYYIDPGTGSIIIQVLIGAVVAGLTVISVYRVRVKTFLSRLFIRRRHNEQSEDNE